MNLSLTLVLKRNVKAPLWRDALAVFQTSSPVQLSFGLCAVSQVSSVNSLKWNKSLNPSTILPWRMTFVHQDSWMSPNFQWNLQIRSTSLSGCLFGVSVSGSVNCYSSAIMMFVCLDFPTWWYCCPSTVWPGLVQEGTALHAPVSIISLDVSTHMKTLKRV